MTGVDDTRSALLADVLTFAREVADALPATREQIDAIEARVSDPLRVAIAGKVKAGKSTLLNALIGDELAPTDAGECTRVITWYEHGLAYRVELTDAAGAVRPVSFDRADGALDVDLGTTAVEDIERLTVHWPIGTLESMTLIDTPGTASASTSISAKSHDFISSDANESTPADAVIYLLRHLHATDVSFLQAFREQEYSTPTPVNCIAVLSRADEVAVGRLDAMKSAERIARRYAADPRLRRLVQNVVPVAGLLAQASTGLREVEFRQLKALADGPSARIDRALLSIDRFITPNGVDDIDLDAFQREQLLHRLGLFGVRFAVDAIRTGAAASTLELADVIRQESGLDQLRSALFGMFGARRDTLKARSALLALQRILDGNDVPSSLLSRAERIWAGAHEFNELRLLNQLRTDELGFTIDQVDQIELLFGSAGSDLSTRVGVPHNASVEDQRARLLEILGSWRQVADSPISSRAVTAAAETVIRTCEGLFAQAR